MVKSTLLYVFNALCMCAVGWVIIKHPLYHSFFNSLVALFYLVVMGIPSLNFLLECFLTISCTFFTYFVIISPIRCQIIYTVSHFFVVTIFSFLLSIFKFLLKFFKLFCAFEIICSRRVPVVSIGCFPIRLVLFLCFAVPVKLPNEMCTA